MKVPRVALRAPWARMQSAPIEAMPGSSSRRRYTRRRAHADATQRAPEVCGRWTALLVIADALASTPPRALPATADPWRATPRDFHHGLLGPASSLCRRLLGTKMVSVRLVRKKEKAEARSFFMRKNPIRTVPPPLL